MKKAENQNRADYSATLVEFADVALEGQVAALNDRITFLTTIYDAISDNQREEALQGIDALLRRLYRTEALLRSHMNGNNRVLK
jgi:hypothetical protein